MSKNNRLKAFLRYDGTGRVIPGSLLLQKKKPKVGDWNETDAYLCCNPGTTTTTTTTIAPPPITTTTTTTVAPECLKYQITLNQGQTGTISGVNCDGEVIDVTDLTGPIDATQCARSLLGTGDIVLAIVNNCDTPCITYTVTVANGNTGVLNGVDCQGSPFNLSVPGPITTNYCFRSITSAFDASVVIAGPCDATTTTTTTTASPLGINVVNVTNICNTMTPGSVTLEATGGVPTYEYGIDFGMGVQWQTDPVILVYSGMTMPGTYNAYVKDSVGTEVSTSVTIQEAPSITATVVEVPPTTPCSNDRSLTINASGGTPPFEYSIDAMNWQSSNTFTGMTQVMGYWYVRDACQQTQGFYDLPAPNPDALSATAELVQPTTPCSTDGQATINATGGTPPYQYSFDGGATFTSNNVITGLDAGNSTKQYNYIVKDSCYDSTGSYSYSSYFFIYAPSTNPLSAIANPTNPSTPCATDGSATIVASGGTPPYLYSFDGGSTYSSNNVISNLSGNNFYSFKVKDSCLLETGDNNFYLNSPTTDPLVCSVVSTTPASSSTASDGSVTFGATGGTAPYEYSIDSGATYQSSPTFDNQPVNQFGSYTIKDACGVTCSGSYSIPSKVKIELDTASSTLSVNCNGDTTGSVALTATGGTGSYEFSIDGGTTWQPFSGNFSSLGAGTYTAVVRDANNTSDTDSLTFEITQPDVLDFTYTISSPVVAGNNNTITVNGTGGTPDYTYAIAETGVTLFPPDNVFTGVAPGTYTLSTTDAKGCSSTKTVELVLPLSVSISSKSDVACQSNNCTGYIMVDGAGGTAPYEYSIDNGVSWSSSTMFMNLCSGNYTIKIKDSTNAESSVSTTIAAPDPVEIFNVVVTNDTDLVMDNGSIQYEIKGGIPTLEYWEDVMNMWITPPMPGMPITKAGLKGQQSYTLKVRDNCGTVVEQSVFVPGPSVIIIPRSFSTDEGSCIIYDITANNIPNGTVLNLNLVSTQGNVTADDFDSFPSTITVNGPTTSTTCIKSDFKTEGEEKFKVVVDYNGQTLGQTGEITINDTSMFVRFNTYIGQTGANALTVNENAFDVPINSKERLALKLGINATDIQEFEIDPVTHEIRSHIITNYVIPNNAFKSSFSVITGNDDITYYIDNTDGKVTAIGNEAFGGNTNIQNVNMPSVTEVGVMAFSDDNTPGGAYTNLTQLNIPEVVTIKDAAFKNHIGLPTSLSFPKLTTIGGGNATLGAFANLHGGAGNVGGYGASVLQSFSAPLLQSINGSNTPGFGAFCGQNKLTTINIPSCTAIGSTTGNDGVFRNITGSTITLTIPASAASDGDVAYLQANNTVTLNLV